MIPAVRVNQTAATTGAEAKNFAIVFSKWTVKVQKLTMNGRVLTGGNRDFTIFDQ
jgi:hypothetical protein